MRIAGNQATETKACEDSGGLRRRRLLLLAVATAVGSMALAADGTAGAMLATEMTGTEVATGLPLGLLVLGSAVAAILDSHRVSSAVWLL